MLAKNIFSKALIGSLVVLHNYSDSNYYTFCFAAPPTRDRIRGEYENKIRRMSPPEKIFEVFATLKKDDNIYMSHLDLFRALCPYNYTTKEKEEEENDDKDGDDKKEGKEDNDDKKKEEKKSKESKFKSNALIEFADANGDGYISLYEYYLFAAFLQMSTKDMLAFFQTKDQNKLTKEDFKQYLKYIQQQNNSQLTMSGILPDPRKQHLSRAELEEVENQIVQNVFKGNDVITFEKIVNLRDLMYKEIYEFEFNTFPHDEKGAISGEDFAKSIICYLQPNLVHKYWKELDDVKFEGSITLEQYITFQKFFRENFDQIADKIKEKGVLTRKKLQKMISDFSATQQTPISNEQIEILVQVLDTNSNMTKLAYLKSKKTIKLIKMSLLVSFKTEFFMVVEKYSFNFIFFIPFRALKS